MLRLITVFLVCLLFLCGYSGNINHEFTNYKVVDTAPSKNSLTQSYDAEDKNTEVIKDETFFEETISKNTLNEKPDVLYYNITSEERDMLARLVFLESSICSIECQRAVASVIFNRLESGKWRKDVNNDGSITLYDIVYYPNAFSPAHKITKTTADQDAYDAVDYVLKNGPTVPTEVRYFRIDYDFNWEGYTNYKIIDNVYFGYFEDWSNGAW